MNETAAEAITARKTRERMAFLALPPREAQSRIGREMMGPTRDVTDPEPDLRYGLEEDFEEDEVVDH